MSKKWCCGAPERPDCLMPTIGTLYAMARRPADRLVAVDAAHRFARSILDMLRTDQGMQRQATNNSARIAYLEARAATGLSGRAAIVRSATASHLLNGYAEGGVGVLLKSMLDEALSEAQASSDSLKDDKWPSN